VQHPRIDSTVESELEREDLPSSGLDAPPCLRRTTIATTTTKTTRKRAATMMISVVALRYAFLDATVPLAGGGGGGGAVTLTVVEPTVVEEALLGVAPELEIATGPVLSVSAPVAGASEPVVTVLPLWLRNSRYTAPWFNRRRRHRKRRQRYPFRSRRQGHRGKLQPRQSCHHTRVDPESCPPCRNLLLGLDCTVSVQEQHVDPTTV
jgi:hypothetical protein